MKEKIAVALAVLLIGMSVSACSGSGSNATDSDPSSTVSDKIPGDNDDELKDNSSIFSSSDDKNTLSSFVSSEKDMISSIVSGMEK